MNSKHISSNGQFASKRAGKSQMWFFKLLFAIIGVIVIGWWYVGFTEKPIKSVQRASPGVTKAVIKEVKAERSPDRLDKAVQTMKREVVMSIRDKESRGFTPKSGEVFYTHDSTKSMRSECQRTGGERDLSCDSFGIMQMKISTIQLWWKQLGRGEITEKDALLLALDNDKSVQFAEDVIFGIKSSCFAWSTCGTNEKEKIEVIRSLSEIK